MIGYFILGTNLNNKKGHTINILKTMEAARLSGLEVTIVCPRYEVYEAETLQRTYLLTQQFPIISIWTPFKYPGRFSFMYFTTVLFFWLIYKRVTARFDFVYFRSEYFFPLVALCNMLRIPFFYELHRVGKTANSQSVKEYLVTKAKGIIVLTEELRQQFLTFNSQILVAHDAVDFEHFSCAISQAEARKKLGSSNGRKICMYTGSVQKIKGIDLLVEVAREVPEIDFYIVGRVERDMQMCLKEIPENVYCTGEYSPAEAPMYLQAADILVLPHPAGPHSQSPMKLFEYMASGKPVVSADLPNIREVLPDENYFYVPEDRQSFVNVLRAAVVSDNSALHTINKQQAKKFTYTVRGSSIAAFVKQSLS